MEQSTERAVVWKKHELRFSSNRRYCPTLKAKGYVLDIGQDLIHAALFEGQKEGKDREVFTPDREYSLML